MKTVESIKTLIESKIDDNTRAIEQQETELSQLSEQLQQTVENLKNAEKGEDYADYQAKKGAVWSKEKKQKKAQEQLKTLKTTPLMSEEEFEQTQKELEESTSNEILKLKKESKPLLKKLVSILEKGLEKEKQYHDIKRKLLGEVMKKDVVNDIPNTTEVDRYSGETLKGLKAPLSYDAVLNILELEN